MTSNEEVEEPVDVVATTTTPVESCGASTNNPPDTDDDASQKHTSSKVSNFLMISLCHYITHTLA